jgi:hypothetical protein
LVCQLVFNLPLLHIKEQHADQHLFALQDRPLFVAETAYEVETMTVTETLPPSTVTVPPPANTRLAARPSPESAASSSTTHSPRTTAIDILVEDTKPTVTPYRPERRPPARWFGGW